MNNEQTIYRLQIEDVQNVAREVFGRELTEAELEKVEENLGDYINWFDLIEMTIENHVINNF
jgi:hypothetical protein